MPSPLGKVSPKVTEEVRTFATQKCIAEGDLYGNTQRIRPLPTSLRSASSDLATLGHLPQRGRHFEFGASLNSNLSIGRSKNPGVWRTPGSCLFCGFYSDAR